MEGEEEGYELLEEGWCGCVWGGGCVVGGGGCEIEYGDVAPCVSEVRPFSIVGLLRGG